MVGEEIRQKLEELKQLCVFGSSQETVHISFNLNSEGWNIDIQQRSAQSLRDDGISMRNIKGDFIV